MEITVVYKITEELNKPLTLQLIERLVQSRIAEYIYSCHTDVDYLAEVDDELEDSTAIIAFFMNDTRLLNIQLNFGNLNPIILENFAENKIENEDYRTVDDVQIAEITFSKNLV